MWENPMWEKCTPTLQTDASMQSRDFFVGIMLTTCTPLCELPPLILRRQRRKHLRRWRRKMFSHCRMIPNLTSLTPPLSTPDLCAHGTACPCVEPQTLACPVRPPPLPLAPLHLASLR